jgi:hypothetical protein
MLRCNRNVDTPLDVPAGETLADTLGPMSARMMGMIADSMPEQAERG